MVSSLFALLMVFMAWFGTRWNVKLLEECEEETI